jgi:hypothetical protein
MVCSLWQISEVVSMKLLDVKQNFDTGPPDLDKFVQIQQKNKIWFFTKIRFFSEKLGFRDWTYNS